MWNRTFILGLCLTLLTPVVLVGQRNVIKLNPFSLFLTTANLQAEHSISKKLSFQLGFFWGKTQLQNNDQVTVGKTRYRWVGVTPELRFYLANRKKIFPSGFFLGPFMRFRHILARWEGEVYDPDTASDLIAHNRSTLPTFGFGGLVGYQLLLGKRVTIEAFGGPQFSITKAKFQATCPSCNGNEALSGSRLLDFSGLEFRLGAALGFVL